MISENPQVIVPSAIPYQPVKPDTVVLQGFEQLNNYFQQISDYKAMTDVMARTYEFSNGLLQDNNIDPNTANQAWDKFYNTTMESLSDVDEQTRLRVDRYLQLKRVENTARITARWHTKQIAEALTQTTDAINNYVKNIRGVDDYADVVSYIETQINNAVSAGILDKAGATKLKNEALLQAQNNLIAAEIDNGKFEDDYKSGVFKHLGIDEQTLLKAKGLYERVKLSDMRFAEALEQKRQIDMFDDLFKRIVTKQAGMKDINNAAIAGLKPQYVETLKSYLRNETLQDVTALQRNNDLQLAIAKGVYDGEEGKQKLYELTSALVSEGKLTARMAANLYALWDKRQIANETLANSPQIDQTAIKEIGSGIGSLFKNMVSDFPVFASGNESLAKNIRQYDIKPPDLREYSTIAEALYHQKVIDYIAKHKSIDIPTLLTIRQQSVKDSLGVFVKDEFAKINSTVFDAFKAQYGVDDNLLSKIISGAQQIAYAYRFLSIQNVPEDIELPKIKIPIKNKETAGLDALWFKLTPNGIIPYDKQTEQFLEKHYGKTKKKSVWYEYSNLW